SSGLDQTAQSARAQQREFREGLLLIHSLSDTFLGTVPVLGSSAAGILQVARETRNMGLAFSGTLVTLSAGGAIFSKLIEAANELAAAQVKARVAIATWDFSAAEAGLKSMKELQEASAHNWDVIGQKGPISIDSIAASLRVL